MLDEYLNIQYKTEQFVGVLDVVAMLVYLQQFQGRLHEERQINKLRQHFDSENHFP